MSHQHPHPPLQLPTSDQDHTTDTFSTLSFEHNLPSYLHDFLASAPTVEYPIPSHSFASTLSSCPTLNLIHIINEHLLWHQLIPQSMSLEPLRLRYITPSLSALLHHLPHLFTKRQKPAHAHYPTQLPCISTHKPDEQSDSTALNESSNHDTIHQYSIFRLFINEPAYILHALHHAILILFLLIMIFSRWGALERLGMCTAEKGFGMNQACALTSRFRGGLRRIHYRWSGLSAGWKWDTRSIKVWILD